MICIALKAAIDSNPEELAMEIIVYGTPAEEGGGGKIYMIEKGAFDEADICMMSHPTPVDVAIPYWLARVQLNFVFHGNSYLLCFVYKIFENAKRVTE